MRIDLLLVAIVTLLIFAGCSTDVHVDQTDRDRRIFGENPGPAPVPEKFKKQAAAEAARAAEEGEDEEEEEPSFDQAEEDNEPEEAPAPARQAPVEMIEEEVQQEMGEDEKKATETAIAAYNLAFSKAVLAQKSETDACLTAYFDRNPEQRGSLRISLTAQPDGSFTDLQVTPTALHRYANLVTCVEGSIESISLPTFEGDPRPMGLTLQVQPTAK